MKHEKVKRLTVLAMLSALAYVIVAVARIPISTVEFLKYEPKDVIIAIGGFMYGPFAALLISVVVSFIEMITVSSTGWIGFLMNVLSTCAFACTAAFIYRRKHTLGGAVLGLVIGAILSAGMMILWNYLITPLYMGVSRDDVATMLLPVFLPFNLLKSGLNAALTTLLYRPVVKILRKTRLFPESQHAPANGSKYIVWIGAFVSLIAFTLIILVLKGIL